MCVCPYECGCASVTAHIQGSEDNFLSQLSHPPLFEAESFSFLLGVAGLWPSRKLCLYLPSLSRSVGKDWRKASSKTHRYLSKVLPQEGLAIPSFKELWVGKLTQVKKLFIGQDPLLQWWNRVCISFEDFSAYTSQTRNGVGSLAVSCLERPWLICQSCKSFHHEGHFACAAHYRQGIMDTALPITPTMITTVTLSLVIQCCHLFPATLGQTPYPLNFSPDPSWELCVVCYWTCGSHNFMVFCP